MSCSLHLCFSLRNAQNDSYYHTAKTSTVQDKLHCKPPSINGHGHEQRAALAFKRRTAIHRELQFPVSLLNGSAWWISVIPWPVSLFFRLLPDLVSSKQANPGNKSARHQGEGGTLVTSMYILQ
jgi:hypothetical protein